MKYKNAGVSLVELLIAIGIMSILALGMATLFNNQFKETKYVSQKLETLDLEKLMIAIFADGSVCSQAVNLGNYTFDSTNLAGNPPPSVHIPSFKASTAPTAPILIQENTPLSGSGNGIKIKDIMFTNIQANGPDSYLAKLSVRFDEGNLVRSLKAIQLSYAFNTDPTSLATAKKIIGCMNPNAPASPLSGLITQSQLAGIFAGKNSIVLPNSGATAPICRALSIIYNGSCSINITSDMKLKVNGQLGTDNGNGIMGDISTGGIYYQVSNNSEITHTYVRLTTAGIELDTSEGNGMPAATHFVIPWADVP